VARPLEVRIRSPLVNTRLSGAFVQPPETIRGAG
jgi:hypothetical protein